MALTFEQLRTRNSTSRFVHEVIRLVDGRDCVDVANDLEQLFQAAELQVIEQCRIYTEVIQCRTKQ